MRRRASVATAYLETATDAPVREHESGAKPARRLTQRAYLNAVQLALDYGAKVVVVSVVTPILVAGLGSSLYGSWQMLSRLISYMTAADGRPTQALKWVIANRQADDDVVAKRRQIGSALGVWLMFLPVLTIVSIIMVWIAPTITKVPPNLRFSIRLTCSILVVDFMLSNLVALP